MRWGSKSERRPQAAARPQPRDEVTGLLNRAAFLHLCGDALGAFVEAGMPARPAVLLVELEGVATAVESEAHSDADEVMRTMAARVTREVGSLGVVARMSDHQFGVLFRHLPTPAAALDLAYRIVGSLSSPATLPSQRRVLVSASCGLVTRSALGDRVTATDLLRGAALALREARRAGRNRIEVCTAELVAEADETVAIGNDLRQALQEKGLRVCYQPLVSLEDRTVLGFEALVRWSHPVHGQVSPSRFVPVAEKFGLISELGSMVLSTASTQVAQWSTAFDRPLQAHVNVSGLDLAETSFVPMVKDCLAATGLPAEQLVLEFTEGAVEPGLDTARTRFEALHELGVRVALDDFGTGLSALSYLQSLSVDILKVDRSYLDSDGTPVGDTRADDLLRGVIGLGRAMGMEIYGEGVEDETQRQRLVRNGCRTGQGYLFAPPLPPEEAVALLRVGTAVPLSPLSRRILAANAATPS